MTADGPITYEELAAKPVTELTALRNKPKKVDGLAEHVGFGFDHRVDAGAVDGAGADRVDPDAFCAQFDRE